MCHTGDLADGVGREGEVDLLALHELHLLLDQVAHGLRQDAVQVLLGQALQGHANGQTTLQLGHQIRRLRGAEGARGDEENEVGVDVAVLRRHRRALDQRQQVALHTLGRGVRGPMGVAGDEFVDLVEEDDAVLLDAGDRLLHHVVLLHLRFHDAVRQVLPRRRHLHPLGPRSDLLPRGHRHGLDQVGGGAEVEVGLGLGRREGQLDHDLGVLHEALADHLAKRAQLRLVSRRTGDGRDEMVLDALFDGVFDLVLEPLLGQLDADVDEVADDLVHVFAVKAHLRELRRLDFDERSVRQMRYPSRDLRL